MRAVYPAGPQKVKLTLRSAKAIKTGRLPRAGTPLAFKQTGRVVEFTVPNLVNYEVAVFEV